MICVMKSSPKPSAEFQNFDRAMRQVLTVSKEELNRRLAADKLAHAGDKKRGPKPKGSTLDRSSSNIAKSRELLDRDGGKKA